MSRFSRFQPQWLLLFLLPLQLSCFGAAGPAAYWQDLDQIVATTVSALEKDSAMDLSSIAFRVAERPELAQAFLDNISLQERALGANSEAMATSAAAYSHALLGIYHIKEKQVLIGKENFESLADQLGNEELDTQAALTAVLLHEGSHAVADLKWDLRATLASREDLDDLVGFNAVVEGYAQHVARRLSSELDVEDGFEVFTWAISAVPEGIDDTERIMVEAAIASVSFAYYDGEDFVDAVAKDLGKEGMQRIFTDPPRSASFISHPEWYLHPELEEKSTRDLPALLSAFDEHYGGDGRMGQQMKMNDPTLAAALAPLSQEDVDEVMGLLLDHRMSAQVEDAAGRMAVMMIYDSRSSRDAARMVELSIKLLKLRDEAFRQGETKIEGVTYEDVDHDGWQGIYTQKTVKAGGEEIEAVTLSLHRSSLTCEFSLVGLEYDAELFFRMLDDLSAAAFPQKE